MNTACFFFIQVASADPPQLYVAFTGVPADADVIDIVQFQLVPTENAMIVATHTEHDLFLDYGTGGIKCVRFELEGARQQYCGSAALRGPQFYRMAIMKDMQQENKWLRWHFRFDLKVSDYKCQATVVEAASGPLSKLAAFKQLDADCTTTAHPRETYMVHPMAKDFQRQLDDEAKCAKYPGAVQYDMQSGFNLAFAQCMSSLGYEVHLMHLAF